MHTSSLQRLSIRALATGILVESVLFPLMLFFGEEITRDLPWIAALQAPAAAAVLRVIQFPEVRKFASQFPPLRVVRAAQSLGFLIQATIFALVALVVIALIEHYRKAKGKPGQRPLPPLPQL